MSLRRILALFSLLACACALAVAGCSSSGGAKRKQPTVLATEYDDTRVGREVSKDVAAQIGVLDDSKLDAYVKEMGRKLLRGMPRRPFAYEFSVVDQFEPNAFALPGGYIFISRGLLALANTEDEIANVIGHEITHAARRHAAAQQALSQRMIPLAMGAQAQMAAYGRDMEREADKGGQLLAAAAGYDPMGMSSFLRDMGNVERLLVGHARMPTFLDTHPTSQERAASNAARAREIRWRRDPALGDTRTAHLRRIDGMALDQRPEAGIFVGDEFLHPDMGFRLRFPQGWMLSNQNQSVGAVSPKRDAIIFMSADQPEGDPRLAAQLYVEQNREELKLELQESLAVKVGAIDAWRMEFKGSSPGGPLTIVTVFIPYAGVTFRITAMTLARLESQYRGRFLSTARSFRPLGANELRSIETRRLRLATARPGEDLMSLSRRTGNAWDANTTAVYNGVFIDHRYEGGELVKIAHVEPYVARGR